MNQVEPSRAQAFGLFDEPKFKHMLSSSLNILLLLSS